MRGTLGETFAMQIRRPLALVAVTLNATPTYPAGGETDEIQANELFVGPIIISLPVGT